MMLQNKGKQKKEGAERDKMREETRKAKAKKRKESKSSSSSAARLAQESKPHRRREKSSSPSPSPSRNAKHPVSKSSQLSWKKTKAPVDERSSSSSLSGGGAAIDDWANCLYYCTIYEICTLVWIFGISVEEQRQWRKDYRQKEWDPGPFQVCFILVHGLGVLRRLWGGKGRLHAVYTVCGFWLLDTRLWEWLFSGKIDMQGPAICRTSNLTIIKNRGFKMAL